jgi:hypothetical protein
MLVMVLQEQNAVAPVGLLVREHDVRLGELGHELGILATPDANYPRAGRARHGSAHSRIARQRIVGTPAL